MKVGDNVQIGPYCRIKELRGRVGVIQEMDPVGAIVTIDNKDRWIKKKHLKGWPAPPTHANVRDNIINLNKQYMTRSGRRVQLFTTGAPEPYPVVGIVQGIEGYWDPEKWTINGKYYVESKDSQPEDLVEVRQEHTVYVNILKSGRVEQKIPFNSEEAAIRHASVAASNETYYSAVAVPITYKDGDNLDLLPD